MIVHKQWDWPRDGEKGRKVNREGGRERERGGERKRRERDRQTEH